MKIQRAIFITIVGLPLGHGCGNAPTASAPGGTRTPVTLPETIIDSGGVTAACDTLFYDDAFGFGFDLPPESDLLSADGMGSNFWAVTFAGTRIGISTSVRPVPPNSLSEYILAFNEFQEANGVEILEGSTVSLSNGTAAYFTALIAESRIDSDQFAELSIDAFAGDYHYNLVAYIQVGSYTDAAHDFMIDLLDSLCIAGSI